MIIDLDIFEQQYIDNFVYLGVPLKDAGSRIRNSGSISKIDKISKTGRDHISQIIYVKCTTLNCQDSVEIKLGHATSTFLLNKKRGVHGELEELIQKNTCNSKIVIPLSDISILEGAKIRYKSKKYPKGF